MMDKKTKIKEILKEEGPSLPSKISKGAEFSSTILASAFLSEMVRNKSIKASFMKVGNSPVYYLKGQEQHLEKFSKFLNSKEKETFEMLKKNGVLADSSLDPAKRVAIRNLKDFAILLKVNFKGKDLFFWKFYSLSQDDVFKEIKKFLKIEPRPEKREIKKGVRKVKGKKRRKLTADEKNLGLDIWAPVSKVIKRPTRVERKVKKKELSKKEQKLDEMIKEYLLNNEITLLKEIDKGKKRFYIVSIKSNLGGLEFLVVGKDKKTVSKADLSLAYQEGQFVKLPVLFLTTGKTSKKTQEHIKKDLKGFLVLRHLKS